jgi:NAD(P) transhydrogenase subunit alpha
MKIAVVKENAEGERRVALVPADIATLIKLGVSVSVESGAGLAAGFTDEQYSEKGAIIGSRADVLSSADVLCAVRSGAAVVDADGEGPVDSVVSDLRALPEGAVVVATMSPYQRHKTFSTIAERGQRAFALEKIPRITRAQAMDVLSSQANLAGYRSVLLAGLELPKMFPMMMTAAGTVVPAKVFVVGVGVAGLQAIATAKRLGAVVHAYDIRAAVKEQVESLGARFVELDIDTGESETSGGYARRMGEEFYRKQREKMLEVVADSDVLITTAAIPGKKAPILVTKEMVDRMHPGSVVVDLAAERGGNCELTTPGETIEHQGVRIVGPLNVASGLANHASQLFSRNVTTFLKQLIKDGALSIDREDEIVSATLILESGGAPTEELAETLGVRKEQS